METDTPEVETSKVLAIPVVKAGKGATLDVDLEKVPDKYYQEALKQGLKVIVNGGSTKINKEAYPDEAELHAAAMAKAKERVAAMIAGDLTLRGATKSAGASQAVMTEARRIARELVKSQIKAAGHKISHYGAAAITEAANSILEAQPDLIKLAEKNLAERGGQKITVALNLKEDPKLVAKAEKIKAEKAAKKVPPGVLSAAQAGKVQPHSAVRH